MSKKLPIFYSALLLTVVNLFLRFAGTSFQVYLSGRIGAEGIGLIQLIMSVGSLAMVAGIAGIRTATMYLTAEEMGKQRKQNLPWVLSSCFSYSILCSIFLSVALYLLAPTISNYWISDPRTTIALRIFACCLPVSCLCSVMTGYFTAANRIGTLATIEIAEQLVSMIVTICSLSVFGNGDPVRACLCIIFGSSCGSILTLICLVGLHKRDRIQPGPAINAFPRLKSTAIPLALADVLRSGISTVENLIVPKRLALNTATENPLAAFGTTCGMVFPILMFPACILFGLAELLIPELSKCNASGNHPRIRYLARRSLKITMLYGLFVSGLLYLISESLCSKLYDNKEAGEYLKLYALLIPMLYCDIVVDAMIKGLGKQKRCVIYNILTSSMDVILLIILLPHYGMKGYYVSFCITHLINFLLSLHLLLKLSRFSIPVWIPMYCIISVLISVWSCQFFLSTISRIIVYISLLFSLLTFFGIIQKEDVKWIRNLVLSQKLSSTASAVEDNHKY